MIVAYLIAAAVIAFGWWRLSLRFWPYAPCRACRRRTGKNLGSNRERWGDCPKCGGSGKRLRRGARQ